MIETVVMRLHKVSHIVRIVTWLDSAHDGLQPFAWDSRWDKNNETPFSLADTLQEAVKTLNTSPYSVTTKALNALQGPPSSRSGELIAEVLAARNNARPSFLKRAW